VFLVWRGELEGRIDANTYNVERLEAIKKLEASFWELKSLKSIVSFSKTIVTSATDLPYLGLENIESNTGSYLPTSEKENFGSAVLFQKGQILFPKLRPYLNKVFLAEFDGVCSTEFHVLESNTVDNAYLSHFLRSNVVVSQTKHLMSGNTLPRLQTEDIENLKIPVPPLEVQQQIVTKFETAYKIKQAKEAEAARLLSSIDGYLLAQLGITLPEVREKKKTFFVYSDKVSGGRLDPYYYQDEYNDLELFLASGKFSLKRLKEICEHIISGKTPPKALYSDIKTAFPISQAGSYTGHFIDIEKVDYTTEKYSYLSVREGDIFILSAAHQAEYVGKKIYLLSTTPQIQTGFVGELLCLRSNPIYCDYQFLFSVLKLPVYINLLNREKRGQTSHLYSNDIQYLSIPLPPLEVQSEIAVHIAALRSAAQQLEFEAREVVEEAKRAVEAMILGKGDGV